MVDRGGNVTGGGSRGAGGLTAPVQYRDETGGPEQLAKERAERDEEDPVRLYLSDIGHYPLLTKDDEVRLARAIEAGAAARLELS
jgi:Sigma-70 factor, region 1.2